MACFLVPAAEALILTGAEKAKKAKEEKEAEQKNENGSGTEEIVARTPFRNKLKWLTSMLWGGSALLMFEHIWHGEVVPWFPFLTAASNPADAAEMVKEMSTVGVLMAVLVTAVWGVMVFVTNRMEKKALAKAADEGDKA